MIGGNKVKKYKIFGQRYIYFAEDGFAEEPNLSANEKDILREKNIYGVFNTIDEVEEYMKGNKETVIVYANNRERFFIVEKLEIEEEEEEVEENIFNRESLLDEEKKIMKEKERKVLFQKILKIINHYEKLIEDMTNSFFELGFTKEDINRILEY